MVASVGSGLFLFIVIASKRHVELIASIRHNDIFFICVFLAFILYKVIFIYLKFYFRYMTKIKFYSYIYALIFEFVFIILIFRALATPVKWFDLLIFC